MNTRPFTWLLIGFLLAVTSCTVLAETIPSTVVPGDSYEGQYRWNAEGGWYPTHTAACDVKAAYYSSLDSNNGSVCRCNVQASNANKADLYQTHADSGNCVYKVTLGRFPGCATGYTWNGTHCVGPSTYSCPSGYALSEDQQSCTRTDCTAGRKVESGMFIDANGDGITQQACLQGCSTNFKGTGPQLHYSFNSQQIQNVYIGDYIADGQTCSPDSSTETPVTAPPEQPQPVDSPEYECSSKGMSYGTVNGQVVCLPPGTDQTPPVIDSDKTTESNPDGSRTETETRDTVSGESVTRETTTTTYDAEGNQTAQTTTTTTAGTGAFCEQNPSAAVCKDGKITGGGTCGEAPVCAGDAIQCAIVFQAWKTRCEAAKTNAALGEGSDLAAQLAGVGENAMTGDATDLETLTDTVDVSGQISTEKFLSGGCIPDKVITGLPMGKTVTIPFSQLCLYLEIFGNIMVIIAMLAAARIVGVF